MFVLFFLGTNVLLAQKKVSGIVKEADTNEPLIGATVVVKGTTNGVITDLDGHYAIEVNANEVLQFAYVGLETHEETVGERTVINVYRWPLRLSKLTKWWLRPWDSNAKLRA